MDPATVPAKRGWAGTRIDTEKLSRAAESIRGIGLDAVLCLEEHDPQFHAVARVNEQHGLPPAAVAAALNALVSYRLAMRGEDWWDCWARYFTGTHIEDLDDVIRAELGFVESCPGAALARNAKKSRVERAARAGRRVLQELWRNPERVLEGAEWLVEGLARSLGARRTSKTVVFAAKMAYYAVRTSGARRPAPWDVDIPVDVRVACFLYSAGIVHTPSYQDIVRRPGPAQLAVRRLAEETGIPPLNLDTLFWRTGWIPRDASREDWCPLALDVIGACAPRDRAMLMCRVFERQCR